MHKLISVHWRSNSKTKIKSTHCMPFIWICYMIWLGNIKLWIDILCSLNILLVLQAWVTRHCCWDCIPGHCYSISTFQLHSGFHCMFMTRSCRFWNSQIYVMPWISFPPFFFLQWLVEYNAALASVCFMILLGFIDDVLDIPWRVYVLFQSVQFISMVQLLLLSWLW